MKTPLPLNSAHRWEWARAFGLDQISFLCVETSGKWILNAREVRGKQSRALLVPVSPSQLHPSEEQPIFTIEYLNGLTPLPWVRSRTLWEELFPSPFRDFSLLFQADPSRKAAIHSPSWLEAWSALWRALSELDQRLSQTEVTFLQVGELSLAFQYYRGKRVQIGVLPGAADFSLGAGTSLARLDPPETPPGPRALAAQAARLLTLFPSPPRNPTNEIVIPNHP